MRRLITTLALLMVCISRLSAQAPRTLSYQGILSDTAGVPKPNGNYAMTFRLYPVAQRGTPLWSETQIVGTSRGLFNAVPGDITPFPDSLRFDRRYWLGIQISPDPELSPRIQLTATGYSLRSQTADTAQYARTGGTGIQAIQNTDNTLAISNPTGPTATVNTRIPLSLNGNWNAEQGALEIIGDKPTIRFSGGDLSGNESWIVHLGSDGPGNLSFFRRSGPASWINVMSLATNGGVGIGTTAPLAALEVHNSPTSRDAIEGVTNAPAAWGVAGVAAAGSDAAVYAYNPGASALRCNGGFYQYSGVFAASPTSTTWTTNKPATVKLNDGTPVKLFSEEAAELYFSDYGEGQLVNGRAHVELDPQFLQTVTIDKRHPIKVFIQEAGECNGMFFTNRTSTGFDVAEMHKGTSSAPFVYRAVCKRKYYEDERLATQEEDLKYNTHVLQTAWPEVIRKADEEKSRAEQIGKTHARTETKD